MHLPSIRPNAARDGAPVDDRAAGGTKGSQAAPRRRAPSIEASPLPPPRRSTAEEGTRPRTTWSGAFRAVGAALHLTRPGSWMEAPEALPAAKLQPASRLQISARAPIRTLEPAAFEQALDAFDDSLDGWRGVDTSLPGAADRDGEQAAWHARTTDLADAWQWMRSEATNVVYEFADRPVGLMSFSLRNGVDRPCVKVHGLATHPGSAGVGGALIEHAVNASEADGTRGLVSLLALPAAIPAYKAMGFRETLFGVMELDPRRTDKWSRQGGPWRLAGHAASGYGEGLAEPDAPGGEKTG